MILQTAAAPVVAAEPSAAFVIAVIAALGGVISPFAMGWLQARNARRMKLDDYARQDAVADKLTARQDIAEEKAAEVAAQAAEAAQLLVESNRKQEEISKVQGAKLDQIHTLVNSNLTAAMQDQLDARTATLVLLKEVAAGRKLGGIEPTKETLGVIASNEGKIAELSAQLSDRKKQTTAAAAQLAVDLARKS